MNRHITAIIAHTRSIILTLASLLFSAYALLGCNQAPAPAPPATSVSEYTYNALGQRSAKTVNGVTTFFVYAPDGKLLAEVDQNGTVTREHIYLGNQAIAQIHQPNTRAQKTYYLHNDHLGTPRVVTDENKQIVWQIDTTPFGEQNSKNARIEQPLRFPGQYFDKESGLHYNYFRDYDPSLGRYIQSDPIGLAGGLNTYSYAYQNPLMYTDPKGLTPAAAGLCFIPGVGWVGCGAAAVGVGGAALLCYLTGACQNFADACGDAWGAMNESSEEEQSSPPPGSKPIDQTDWSGDHQGIKEGIGAGPADSTKIDPSGNVWGQNPNGTWTNHGSAGNFTGSGKPSGRKGKDRRRRW